MVGFVLEIRQKTSSVVTNWEVECEKWILNTSFIAVGMEECILRLRCLLPIFLYLLLACWQVKATCCILSRLVLRQRVTLATHKWQSLHSSKSVNYPGAARKSNQCIFLHLPKPAELPSCEAGTFTLPEVFILHYGFVLHIETWESPSLRGNM